MTAPMTDYGRYYARLSAHEVRHPTAEQLATLRRLCEQAFGVQHDAPYAGRLWAEACDWLGNVGGVGAVWRRYEDLATVVKRVLAAAEEG